jgi:hypothetical protein
MSRPVIHRRQLRKQAELHDAPRPIGQFIPEVLARYGIHWDATRSNSPAAQNGLGPLAIQFHAPSEMLVTV